MAVRLHILGQTVQLTFPIGVCFIALAFRGEAIQISLAHSWTEGEKKTDLDYNHCFHDNINVDTKGNWVLPFNNMWELNGSGRDYIKVECCYSQSWLFFLSSNLC